MKVLKCAKCGNMITYLDQKVCVPKCCGETMEELAPNSTDAAGEKHVPAVAVDGNKVCVQVGSVEHPMMEKHYIQFIALETNQGVSIKYLKPEMKPVAEFVMAEGEVPQTAYEYCNLHGFWKADI